MVADSITVFNTHRSLHITKWPIPEAYNFIGFVLSRIPFGIKKSLGQYSITAVTLFERLTTLIRTMADW